MERTIEYCCPSCRTAIRETLKAGGTYTCFYCKTEYRVEQERRHDGAEVFSLRLLRDIRPLGLPAGSIRALVMFALVFCFWALLLGGRELPEYLLALILTIMGSYFASRRQSDGHIYRQGAAGGGPLYLPRGTVRWLMIASFAVGAVYVHSRGVWLPRYLEFFAILLGLLGGYIFARASLHLRSRLFHATLEHGKGLLVLAAAAGVTYLVANRAETSSPTLMMVMSTAMSFYFGSRS